MDNAEQPLLSHLQVPPILGDVSAVRDCSSFSRHRRRLVVGIFLGLALALTTIVLVFAIPRYADPDHLWVEAERAFLAGHWDQARTSLDTLRRVRSRTGLDLMLEAQLAIAQQRPEEAFAALSQIPEDHKIAPQARLLAARLWREQHCIKKAEAELHRALALKPDLIEAHKELVYILGIQSRRREVDAEFRALSRLTSLSHHDLFTWALTHFTHWSPDIVADLDGFIQADPDDRHSRLALAQLLLEQPGEDIPARIDQVLTPLPENDPDALALKIEFAFHRGHITDAEELLARAPADHPRIARIRGEIALRRRDVDAAIRYFQQALGDEPYDRVSPMHLAQALRLKGETATAQVYLDRVERLNAIYNLIIRVRAPGHQNQASDLNELGKACENAGLIEESRGWFTLAIAMNPLDAEAQRALARLGKPAGKASQAPR